MATLRVIGILVLAGISVSQAPADESLTAESIMARVAANQDHSEKLRSQYIYQQHIHVASRKTSGKVLREETADYHVVPKPAGTERTVIDRPLLAWRQVRGLCR
jgi:hypothetical protein